jgi:S-adenosylmethionine decarboxylase
VNSVVAASGIHILADFYGVAPDALRDVHGLERLLKRAALYAGAQVLSTHFHSFGNEEGVTGVVLLAESHISIHTWPESGFAAADIFMCGSAAPQRALEQLTNALRPSRQRVETTDRGKSV